MTNNPWEFRITTPMPPSVWDIYEGFGKYRHKTQVAVIYQKVVRLQLATMDYTMAPAGRLGVHIALWFENNRSDVENRQKLPLDTLQGYVYKNDKQIKDIHAYEAGIDKANPRCELWFYMWENRE